MTIIITYVFVIFVEEVLYNYIPTQILYIFNIDSSLYDKDVRVHCTDRTICAIINLILCLFLSADVCWLFRGKIFYVL